MLRWRGAAFDARADVRWHQRVRSCCRPRSDRTKPGDDTPRLGRRRQGLALTRHMPRFRQDVAEAPTHREAGGEPWAYRSRMGLVRNSYWTASRQECHCWGRCDRASELDSGTHIAGFCPSPGKTAGRVRAETGRTRSPCCNPAWQIGSGHPARSAAGDEFGIE